MSDQAPTITKAELAKKLGVKIRVHQMKDGIPVRDKETGEYKTTSKNPTAGDIMSFAEYGDHFVVVTIDGQKVKVDK